MAKPKPKRKPVKRPVCPAGPRRSGKQADAERLKPPLRTKKAATKNAVRHPARRGGSTASALLRPGKAPQKAAAKKRGDSKPASSAKAVKPLGQAQGRKRTAKPLGQAQGRKRTAKPLGQVQGGDATAEYQRKKDRERQRQSSIVRAGQEIGPIPPCANPARRAAAEQSLETWERTYLPNRFRLPGCKDHSEQNSEIDRICASGGLQAIAAPRGDGKTTRCEAGVLKAVLTGQHEYGVLITATQKHAPKRMGSLKMALLTSEPLAEDYPEVCFPLRAMGNRANKCAGMLSDGQYLWPGANGSQWAKTCIVLPTVPNSKASGAIIEAAGLIEATRGLSYARPDGTVARPTIALIDDPQTDRSARSPTMCRQREDAISKGILLLGPPDRELSALASVTVIEPGDVADCLLDRVKHPAWHGIRKQMLYTFPSNMRLWDQYATVYLGELAAGSEDFPRSAAFYDDHRSEMDLGAAVAWEARHPGCQTAIEFAMRQFYKDRRAFMSEFQNTPEREGDLTAEVATLNVQQICNRQSNCARYTAPLGTRRLTWFTDVHKDLLYYVVTAWAPGFTGSIIDYGTWPHQDAAYFDHRHPRHKITTDPRITATSREGQCQQALDLLWAELHARVWKREDGVELTLELGLGDANDGAVTDAVYEAARGAIRKHGLRVIPSHGTPFGPHKCPISRWDHKTNADAVLGDEWMMPPPKKCRIVRHVVFDAGRRKTFMWKRLATPAGDPGSLTLFADEPSRHQLFAEHLAAESGTKVSGPYGEMISWTLAPGLPNHWLDCLSGVCTAESMLGGRLASAVPGQTARKAKPKADPDDHGVTYMQL